MADESTQRPDRRPADDDAVEAPRQQPAEALDNPARLQSRRGQDFARMPAEETHPVRTPGTGPRGTLDRTRLELPPLLITLGIVVAFLTFLVQHGAPLVLGLLLILAGVVTSAARRPRRSRGIRGSGTLPR